MTGRETLNSSIKNDYRSERSRKSIIKGSPAFIWDSSIVKTDRPYVNHKYHIPFNKPPNELNFLGGLGIARGFRQSKVHPIRPTTIQRLFHMKTGNRIAVTFTEPLRDANCCVERIKPKADQSSRKNLSSEIKKIVNKVWSVNLKRNQSDDDDENQSMVPTEKRRQPVTRSSINPANDYDQNFIDNKPFYYDKKALDKYVKSVIDKYYDDSIQNTIEILIESQKSHENVSKFNHWAVNKRKLFKENVRKLNFPKTMSGCPDDGPGSVNVNVNVNEMPDTVKSINVRAKKTFRNGDTVKNIPQNISLGNHLNGFMNGPFEKVLPDVKKQSENKFGIPLSVIERAKNEEDKLRIKEDTLNRVRLAHMGFKQPPESSTSSSSFQSSLLTSPSRRKKQRTSRNKYAMENVKRLALIRTPYFIIPTIKVTQIKKKLRFRNKFLKKQRLKRINLLFLSERCDSSNGNVETDKTSLESSDTLRKFFVKDALFKRKIQLITRCRKQNVPPNAQEKFYKIISDKYFQHKNCYEFKTQKTKAMSFEAFKQNIGEFNGEADKKHLPQKTIQHSVAGVQPIVGVAKSRDESRNEQNRQSSIDEMKARHLALLSKRMATFKLSKFDDFIGPVYVDPYFMDKLRNEIGGSPGHFKCYTNLFKNKFWQRNRLHVNGTTFEHERLNVNGKNVTKFEHRLVTEWDDYYINELRYRPKISKFCVKTDIFTIRNIVRKNFIIYYIHENLLNLNQAQLMQEQLMDKVEASYKLYRYLFDKWKCQAYAKVIEAMDKLKLIQNENMNLKNALNELESSSDKLNKEILTTETRWNEIIITQNYYYLLMDIVWRSEYDWIHRTKDNRLLLIMDGFAECPKRNIRKYVMPQDERTDDSAGANTLTQFDSGCHVKLYFDIWIQDKLEKMLRVQPEFDVFKTVLWNLRNKTFACLLQFNKSFWIFMEMLKISGNMEQKVLTFRDGEKSRIDSMQKSHQFIVNQRDHLENKSKDMLKKKLPLSVVNENQQKIITIGEVLYRHIIPLDDRIGNECQTMFTGNRNRKQVLNESSTMLKSPASTLIGKTFQVHQYIMHLLNEIDTIPLEILRKTETFVRTTRKATEFESKQAVLKQKRFDVLKKQLENQFRDNRQ